MFSGCWQVKPLRVSPKTVRILVFIFCFFQLNINWKFLSLLPFWVMINSRRVRSAAAATSSISFAAQDHFSLSNQSHIETSFSSSKSLIKLLRSYFAIIHCYFPIYSPNLAQNLSLPFWWKSIDRDWFNNNNKESYLMERRIDNDSGHWRPNNWLSDSIWCPMASRVRRGCSQFCPILAGSQVACRLHEREMVCLLFCVCLKTHCRGLNCSFAFFFVVRATLGYIPWPTICALLGKIEKKATLKLLPLIAAWDISADKSLTYSHCVDFV